MDERNLAWLSSTERARIDMLVCKRGSKDMVRCDVGILLCLDVQLDVRHGYCPVLPEPSISPPEGLTGNRCCLIEPTDMKGRQQYTTVETNTLGS